MRSAFSKTVTRWPARASCCAAARPAGPEPTIATVLPVRETGRTGATQPSSNPLSMMFHSMTRMDTGSLLMPSTQADSQGAGHRRPVNSGKLLVACRALRASFQRPRWTRSFHSGIRFDRTAVVALAEGHAAVHAARALGFEFVFGDRLVELPPVLDAELDRATLGALAGVLQESLHISHGPPVPCPSAPAPWRPLPSAPPAPVCNRSA